MPVLIVPRVSVATRDSFDPALPDHPNLCTPGLLEAIVVLLPLADSAFGP